MANEQFVEILRERVVKLSVAWIQFEQGGGARSLSDVFNALHTIKGEAAVLGLRSVAQIAHSIEELLGDAGGAEGLDMAVSDMVLDALDVLSEILESGEDGEARAAEITACIRDVVSGAVPQLTGESDPPASDASDTGNDSHKAQDIDADAGGHIEPPQTATSAVSDDVHTKVHVTMAELDRMRDLVGELLHARWLLELTEREMAKTLADMPSSVADVPAIGELRRLDKRLRDEMLRSFNLVDGLEELARGMRMVPVRSLLDRYPRMVRELSRDLDKPTRCEVHSNSTYVDRSIRDALHEPLLHLIRNAIDHGIESPEVREAEGKATTATVSIDTRVTGNLLRIRVSDDGGGIDVDSVRERATSLGLLKGNTDHSEEQLWALVFASRMSTRTAVSQVSGRGIGLSIVRDTVVALGGDVRVETSEIGVGTTFLLTVPITTSIATMMLFQVGDQWFALPASAIKAVHNSDEVHWVNTIDGAAVRYGDKLVPIVSLADTLQEGLEQDTAEQRVADHAAARIVILTAGTRLVGFADTHNHSLREAVVRPAEGSDDVESLVIAGVGLEGGKVALVLDPRRLIGGEIDSRALNASAVVSSTVMVVDDSPIIRSMLVDALEPMGLRLVEAEDGQHAADIIDGGLALDLLVTDIEMPRLDGLGLVARLRNRPGLPRVPVIVVSSRGSDEDKLAALTAGADSYVIKSEFSAPRLRELVERYLGR